MLKSVVWRPHLRRVVLAAVLVVSIVAAAGSVVAGSGWARWVLAAAIGGLGLGLAVTLKLAFGMAVDVGLVRERMASHDAADAELLERTTGLGARLDAHVQATGEALSEGDAALERVAQELAALRAAVERRHEQTDAAIAAAGQQLATLRDDQISARKDLEAAKAEALEHAATVRRELRVGRGETYQQLTRLLSPAARRALVDEWPERLGIAFDGRRLDYLERKLIDVEARCRGRLAAATDDAILRALVASALTTRRARVLEVGVLFAVNAVFLHDVAGFLYSDFHQTLIDPFFGYYGDEEPDPYTGVLVSEAVARENLRTGGVPSAAYELLVGRSTDEDVRAAAGSHTYDAVLIDGDHSYEGVAADFSWSAGLIAAGGYLLIDDYRGPSWPDVTRFVDEVAMADDRFELVGSFARTAVFRKR